MLGTMFISLLKMVMIPLIFTSVMIGVSSIKSGKRVMFCESEAFSYFKEKERLISKMTTSIAMVEMPEGWTPI